MVTENPQFGRETERENLTATVAHLNEQMGSGGSIYDSESLKLIRTFPHPIVVDFNNVLVNNAHPLVANPEAKNFVDELRKIGTVVIVTSAHSWKGVRENLENFDLWHEDMVLLTKYNYSSEMADPAMNKAVDDYVNLSRGYGRQYEKNKFFVSGKRLAPIFNKTIDIPIIDDNIDIVTRNPGLLGIQPWAFAPEDKTYEEITRRTGVSLSKVIETVRQHYTLSDLLRSAPFRDALTRSAFDKGFSLKSIMALARNPSTIIRADRWYDDMFMEYKVGEFTFQQKLEQYKAAGAVFNELSSRYNIAVARHEVVIGPNPENPNQPIFYTVSERIEGTNLSEKQYPKGEKIVAQHHLENLYSSLAQYMWGIYQNGGYVIDLFDELAMNHQFVYGKREGEAEDKIWFVDVDGKAWHSAPHNSHAISSISRLVQMIEESEGKLGSKLTKSRQKIIDLFSQLNESDPNYRNSLFLRREVGDSTAGSETEDKRVLQEALDEFLATLPKFRFTDRDFELAMAKYFATKPFEREHKRQSQHAAEFGSSFSYQFYNQLAESEFIAECVSALVHKVNEKGAERFRPLERRHGSILFLISDVFKPQVRETVLAKRSRDLAYLKAKAESDKIAIAQLGWEADILPHLDEIFHIFRFQYAERLLDEYRHYYAKLACSQQGITYPLPLEVGDIVEKFHQYAASRKRSPEFNTVNFRRFALNLVSDYLNQELSQKLGELKKKYKSSDVSILHELILHTEVERLTREAF